MENITERKRVEKKLNVSEVRYRRLFETAQDGILLLEAQTGQIVDANPFLLELLGYAYQEVVGRKLWEIGPFKDITASRYAFQELQANRYIRYEDLPLETKDGRQIYVEFVSNVYMVNSEEIIQCNIRNISDRKQAEEALQKLHAELEIRVIERTAELAQANEALQREIIERMRVEEEQITVVLENEPASRSNSRYSCTGLRGYRHSTRGSGRYTGRGTRGGAGTYASGAQTGAGEFGRSSSLYVGITLASPGRKQPGYRTCIIRPSTHPRFYDPD